MQQSCGLPAAAPHFLMGLPVLKACLWSICALRYWTETIHLWLRYPCGSGSILMRSAVPSASMPKDSGSSILPSCSSCLATCKHWPTLRQGLTGPLKIWGLTPVGTPAPGGLPPLHALNYYRCAKVPGGCPLPSLSRQGRRAQPLGDPRGLSNPALR